MENFDLEISSKKVVEINTYLNVSQGYKIAVEDLLVPVAAGIRSMSVRQLVLTLGPFSQDFRIEMRKRQIEQVLSEEKDELFPVTEQMHRGTATSNTKSFKEKAKFDHPGSFVHA